MTDTLLAIDETYRRWADILDLVVAGQMDEAKCLLDITTCPLCRLAHSICSKCPVVIEHKMKYGIAACSELKVYKVAFDGVLNKNGSTRTISALVRMLWLLDWLWERVRKREG